MSSRPADSDVIIFGEDFIMGTLELLKSRLARALARELRRADGGGPSCFDFCAGAAR